MDERETTTAPQTEGRSRRLIDTTIDVLDLLTRAENVRAVARKAVVEYIVAHQRVAGISQKEVGRQCGVDQGNYNKLVRGQWIGSVAIPLVHYIREHHGFAAAAPRRRGRMKGSKHTKPYDTARLRRNRATLLAALDGLLDRRLEDELS